MIFRHTCVKSNKQMNPATANGPPSPPVCVGSPDHAQIPTPESNALENPKAAPRDVFVFDLADFRIAAAPFAQKSFSILLDTHVLGEHDHVEVSQF
jgi:hypothetical protein